MKSRHLRPQSHRAAREVQAVAAETLEQVRALPEVSEAAAQAQLERVREAMGIPAPTAEDARFRAAWAAHRLARHEEPIEAIAARGAACAATEGAEDRAQRILDGRMDAAIPDAFWACARCAEYCDVERGGTCPRCAVRLGPVTWRLLARLRGPDGQPALGGVEDHRGHVLVGQAAVDELRQRLQAPRVVLLGETGAGKSLVLAAHLDAEIRAGAERARWCSAVSLRAEMARTRAEGALLLGLDDLGEELAGAEPGQYVLAERCAPAHALFRALARQRGRRIVVTTFLEYTRARQGDRPGIVELYDGGTARRVYEGAEVIRLRRTR